MQSCEIKMSSHLVMNVFDILFWNRMYTENVITLGTITANWSNLWQKVNHHDCVIKQFTLLDEPNIER